MHFNNPKVRQRMIEHITFAVSSVSAAIPEKESHGIEQDLANGLRNPIVVTVLNYTLSLDQNLKNSFRWNEGDLVDTGKGLEPIKSDLLL